MLGKKPLKPFDLSRPDPGRREKINLNFCFRTSLWCLERFYEGLKGLHKTFWGITKKCENKNLIYFLFMPISEMNGTGRVNEDIQHCKHWYFYQHYWDKIGLREIQLRNTMFLSYAPVYKDFQKIACRKSMLFHHKNFDENFWQENLPFTLEVLKIQAVRICIITWIKNKEVWVDAWQH